MQWTVSNVCTVRHSADLPKYSVYCCTSIHRKTWQITAEIDWFPQITCDKYALYCDLQKKRKMKTLIIAPYLEGMLQPIHSSRLKCCANFKHTTEVVQVLKCLQNNHCNTLQRTSKYWGAMPVNTYQVDVNTPWQDSYSLFKVLTGQNLLSQPICNLMNTSIHNNWYITCLLRTSWARVKWCDRNYTKQQDDNAGYVTIPHLAIVVRQGTVFVGTDWSLFPKTSVRIMECVATTCLLAVLCDLPRK